MSDVTFPTNTTPAKTQPGGGNNLIARYHADPVATIAQVKNYDLPGLNNNCCCCPKQIKTLLGILNLTRKGNKDDIDRLLDLCKDQGNDVLIDAKSIQPGDQTGGNPAKRKQVDGDHGKPPPAKKGKSRNSSSSSSSSGNSGGGSSSSDCSSGGGSSGGGGSNSSGGKKSSKTCVRVLRVLKNANATPRRQKYVPSS